MDVSIIVPLYKGKTYIARIIKMICENQNVMLENQMIKDIEVIFINDYPDEEIKDINFVNDCNISLRLYTNEDNLGIHKSRLRGLSKANGQYIVFLDQDDEIRSYYLYRQFNSIGQADAVLCNGICRNNKRIYKDIIEQKQAVTKKNYISHGNMITSPGQIMLRRDAIPVIWKDYVLQENGSDDVFLWTLMLCQGKKFALNTNVDYVHKEDGNNTSLNFANMKKSVEELLRVVKDEKILDTDNLMMFTEMIQGRIHKYDCYINVLENWPYVIENVISVISKNRFQRIAVYGYGIIGKKLLKDLEKANIAIECVIDRSARNFENANYRIYEPDNLPEGIELIIITAIFDEKKVREKLKKFDLKAISLVKF